ncbi:MAG: wbuB [Chitinophagaceae bacterium]|nr:MAG: wbuB [Chitinophagaceae bacterium]
MKILFLTLARIDNIEVQGIYTDLLRKFRDNGHELTIVSPSERKLGKKTNYVNKDNVRILNVWTTNFQKTNLIEKGITTLFLEFYYYVAIKKYVKYNDLDLILYSTPPITFTYLIKRLKLVSNAKTYLLLKDIFPQNAVDLNLLKYSSVLYKYFRKQEKILYSLSDYIGCMSPANLDYVLENNPEIEKKKLEVNPNSIEVNRKVFSPEIDLYTKYCIPKNKVIFIFGGNLGIPQGINFLKTNIAYCKTIKEAFFLIVGDGTEYNNFSNWIEKDKIFNALLIKELPKSEYDHIIKLSHVGLIFLSPQFTIPNFPSRLLSYMQNKLPVICATDSSTDIGKIAFENSFGYTCLTTDHNSFYEYVIKLLNKELRITMGENALNYLVKEYSVEISYNKIVNKIN